MTFAYAGIPLCGIGYNKGNVVTVAVAFCGLFTAFNSLQNFVTSLNKSLGFTSLGILYTTLALSTFIAPAVVKTVGNRPSLFVGALTYCMYIGANIKVIPPILLSVSAVMGVGAAVLWTAQGAHLAQSSDPGEMGKMSGLFFAIFQVNQVAGNLIVAILLHVGLDVHLVIAILTGVGLLFSLLLLGVRKTYPLVVEEEEKTAVQTALEMSPKVLMMETARLFRSPDLLILLLPMFYSGLSQTYFFGIFPRQVPLATIGWLMACFGAADASGSLLLGRVSDKTGRGPVLAAGSLACLAGVCLANAVHILEWRTWPMFVAATLLGAADASYNTQIYAILGEVFPDSREAAFAGFKMVQAGATGVAFVTSQFFGFFVLSSAFLASLVLGCLMLVVFFSRRPGVVAGGGGGSGTNSLMVVQVPDP